MTEQTCQKFHAGYFLLNNAPQSGRQLDSDQINILIDNNQCYTTWKMADILKISKSSVENNFHQLGYVHYIDIWVPHEQKESF